MESMYYILYFICLASNPPAPPPQTKILIGMTNTSCRSDIQFQLSFPTNCFVLHTFVFEILDFEITLFSYKCIKKLHYHKEIF